ncbi:hypothetical protein BI372_11565 [Acinetobacter pittii]|nr:hypothetical protein BI372_11565 [Acinetobacter pittii]
MKIIVIIQLEKIAAMLVLKEVIENKNMEFRDIRIFDNMEKVEEYIDQSKILWESYLSSEMMQVFKVNHICHYLVLLRFLYYVLEKSESA